MPEATGYSSTYLSSLQTMLNNGNYTGFWSSLGANSDTYAEKAAVVTGATPSSPFEQMIQDMVQIHWDNTAGSGMYASYFPAYAIDHAQNYLNILTSTGDFPSTTQIIDSYDDARNQVNGDYSISLPKEVVFDGVWAAAQVGSEDTGALHLPEWNLLLGMESARDDGTPDKGITVGTSLTILAEDFLGLTEKYAGEANTSLENMALDFYGKVLGLQQFQSMATPAATLPDAIEGCLAPWAAAPTTSSPLVIDLSSGHTGVTLTTFNAATTTTFFDLEGTGFAQQTAWTSGNTGFLVSDLNGNGKIDNVNEMFGSTTVDGFAKLATLDSNGDLKIDSHDSAWGSLQVWLDANGNGITDSGELHSLASLNITSIDLAGVAASTSTINGNQISHTSTVTFSDGSTSAIDDAWFARDTMNTYYTGNYTLNPDTLFLPDLRGYGTIPELSIAMSQDSTLKGLVSSYVTNFGTSGFALSTLDSDVTSILYRWAAVDGVDPGSRGASIDARELDFMEHLTGQPFQYYNSPGQNNPGPGAAFQVDLAFHNILEEFKADILLQAGGNSLFTNPVTYDPFTGTPTGDTSLSETGVDALAGHAPAPGADNVTYWMNVVYFIDTIKGLANVTSTEAGWLDTTVSSTDSTLTWSDVVDLALNTATTSTTPTNYIYGGSSDTSLSGTSANDEIHAYYLNATTIHGNDGNDTIYGAGYNDILYGDLGRDTLWGGAGDDTLYGGNNNDTLHGEGGNDILDGGAGGNFLYGGAGDDSYHYSGGGDYIDEEGSFGNDQIVLPSGITAGNLSFARVVSADGPAYYFDLLITIAGSGTIQIHDQFGYSGYQVETIVFNDSSTLDLTTITNPDVYLGNNSPTYFDNTGASYTVYGGSGNDLIELYAATGNHTIDGGAGNDTLQGGSGSDTYIASPGFDTIYDTAGTDTINIPVGYSASDVTFSRHIGTSGPDNDLIVTVRGLGEIQIQGQFSGGTNAIENLHFLGDSSTISLNSQVIQTIGSTSADSLVGIASGVAGNYFDGRGGNDNFTGGTGNNTFVVASGFGTDDIYESSTAGTNTISFTGVDPSHIRMWTDTYGSLHLQDTSDTAHGITVHAGITGSGNYESTIGQYLSQITFDDSAHTVWSLTGGLNITADNSGDNLYGTTYGDTITGGTGADYIYGNGGNDTITGGAGADYLAGGSGNDTYVISSGFGNATVYETTSSGTDTIHLTGLDPNHIRMWTDTSGNLHLQDSSDTSHNITVTAGITGSGNYESTVGQYVEQITFDSGYATTWSLTGGLTLTGTTSAESLYGTANGDTITGMGGNDFIYGNGGNDTIAGGAANDYLDGGTGTDTLTYAAASAAITISLALATAQVTGGAGTDTISNFENLTGSAFNDTLTGDGNANVIEGLAGNDTMNGGAGTDTLTYVDATAGISISLALATAQVTGGAGTDTISNFENLTGSAFNDTLTGDGNANVIDGGAGNDTIQGGAGNDTLTGGAGTDTATYAAASAAVTVNLATLTAQNTVGAGTDTISGFENLTGSAFNDTLTGDGNANVIEGLAGNDTMNGGAGTDTLTYIDATAAVTVNLATVTAQNTVGAGTDTISNFENLTGSAFNDTLTGDGNANVIEGLAGNDTMNGAAGTDTLTYVDATSAITISLALATAQVTGGAGTDTISNFENLTGSAFNDTLTGDGNANVIDGGAGNDTIEGGAGNDTLTGGAGTDTLTYATATAAVTVNLATATAQNTVGAGTDTISGFENLTGSGFNDTLTGDSNANTISGGAGNDIIAGRGGADVLDGGAGTDTVDYSAAAAGTIVNLATGTASNDGDGSSDTLTTFENITGSAFDDKLTGDANANVIDGGAGNDTIQGGAGNDTLTGGTGTDLLTYAAATAAVTVNLATATAQNTVGAGTDTISGFENLTGSAFADTLTGDGNANVIQGLAGNDTMNGGAGTDTLTYVDATAAVTVNLATATAQNTVGAGTDTISNFENLTGSAFNDTLTGDGNANVIQGLAGNDTMVGGAGTDTVTYIDATAAVTVSLATTSAQNTVGAGTDTISGFENLTGSAFNDTLTGDGNANVLQGLAGNDLLVGGAGNDTLDGGTGTDTVSYAASASGVTVNLSAGTAAGDGSDTLTNIENVTGSSYNDTFTTTTGVHVFDGGAGTNTLSYSASSVGVTVNLSTGTGTGDGSDTFTNIENITGSSHNDTIITGSGTHVLDGGAGTDTVSYASASVGVTVNLYTGAGTGDGSDTLSNIENVTGSTHNDTFVSNSGNNAFDGGAGTDTISYASAASAVTVNLATGAATGDGTDTLTNIENVTGSSHADTLTGNSGANVIDGGGGADTLYGGSGADTFMFKALTALGAAVTIADYSASQGDKIDITDVLTGHYDPVTNAIGDFVSLTTSGSNTLLKVDLDGAGTTYSPTTIATISGVTGLDIATMLAEHHLLVPT
jgi:Ca2+-binding RTX toxin-like protein